MKKLFLILFVVLICGCAGLVPNEHKTSESVKSSEAIAVAQNQTIKRTLEVVPEMAIKISQPSAVSSVALPAHQSAPTAAAQSAQSSPVIVTPAAIREQVEVTTQSSTDGGSIDSARGKTEVSIPMGVKLALLGIGLAILIGALVWGWKYVKTTAFGQAIEVADMALANQIRVLREKVAASIDPKEHAETQARIASLEAERGKLAKT